MMQLFIKLKKQHKVLKVACKALSCLYLTQLNNASAGCYKMAVIVIFLHLLLNITEKFADNPVLDAVAVIATRKTGVLKRHEPL